MSEVPGGPPPELPDGPAHEPPRGLPPGPPRELSPGLPPEPPSGLPPQPPPEPPRPRSLLLGLLSVGAGIFLGLCGATLCCLFGIGFVDRLHLPVPVFLVAAGLLFLAPLLLLLTRRPRAPFQVGLVLGLSLTGLIMGACGTLMR